MKSRSQIAKTNAFVATSGKLLRKKAGKELVEMTPRERAFQTRAAATGKARTHLTNIHTVSGKLNCVMAVTSVMTTTLRHHIS